MSRKWEDEFPIGQRYKDTLWLILGKPYRNEKGRWVVPCQCECGEPPTPVDCSSLKNGRTKSCRTCARTGCGIGRHGKNNPRYKHGESDTRLYASWNDMIRRCYTAKPGTRNHKNYQEKGIIVCKSWKKSFEAFAEDMGPTYKPGYHLHRKRSSRGYCKSNCEWLDSSTHAKIHARRRARDHRPAKPSDVASSVIFNLDISKAMNDRSFDLLKAVCAAAVKPMGSNLKAPLLWKGTARI